MLNVCGSYNSFAEPSLYDDFLVDIISISTPTGNIYEYLCSILSVLYKKSTSPYLYSTILIIALYYQSECITQGGA